MNDSRTDSLPLYTRRGRTYCRVNRLLFKNECLCFPRVLPKFAPHQIQTEFGEFSFGGVMFDLVFMEQDSLALPKLLDVSVFIGGFRTQLG